MKNIILTTAAIAILIVVVFVVSYSAALASSGETVTPVAVDTTKLIDKTTEGDAEEQGFGPPVDGFPLDFEEGDGLAVGNVYKTSDDDFTAEIVHGDCGDWLGIYRNDGRRLGIFPFDFEKNDGLAVGDVYKKFDNDFTAEIVHADRSTDRITIYSLDGWSPGLRLTVRKEFNLKFNRDFEEGDGLVVGNVYRSYVYDTTAEIVHADRSLNSITVYRYDGLVLADFYVDVEGGDGLAVGDVLSKGIDQIVYGDRNDEIRIYYSSIVQGGFPLDFEGGDGLAVGDVAGFGISQIVHGNRGVPANEMQLYDFLICDSWGNKIYSFGGHDFERGDRLAVGDVDGDHYDEIVHGDRSADDIFIYQVHQAPDL